MRSSGSLQDPPIRSDPEATPRLARLDGLRAIAVLAVLVDHFSPIRIAVGPYGVKLFFVLSGFLITGILLRCRTHMDAGQGFGVTLRQFYIRRALRILPIVYLVLVVGLALGSEEIRRTLIWHLTFTSNLLFSVRGFPPMTSHFWSLAVEEQFYLVWPALILLLPRRHLPALTLALIVGAAVFRASAELWFTGFYPQILTPAVVDSLAFGALLSWAGAESRATISRWIYRLGFVMMPIALFEGISDEMPELKFVLGDSVAAASCAWILVCALEERSKLGRLLEAAPLCFIGRISYGLYVYHLIVPSMVRGALAEAGLAIPPWEVLWLPCTAITFALAILSWYLIEVPINRNKRFFPYRLEPAVAAVALPPSGYARP
ncbi:MAG: acyltransferase family protein [Stellaceae bacterium]